MLTCNPELSILIYLKKELDPLLFEGQTLDARPFEAELSIEPTAQNPQGPYNDLARTLAGTSLGPCVQTQLPERQTQG